MSDLNYIPPSLSRINILAFGVGHIFNDLCASMWFTYFLVFFHFVVKLDNAKAGYLMLLGQIADAISTPLVGLEVDRSKGFCGYSKIKSWHLLGTFAVAISFPFVFMKAIGSNEYTSDLSQFVYYSPFIVIFQFGWATTQISHLSLIPALTPLESVRVQMNALRYGFTVASNITVYVVAWILLRSNNEDAPGAHFFEIMAWCVLGMGILFSFLFHIGIRENDSDELQMDSMITSNLKEKMKPLDWFKKISFYQVALLYMCTRLVVNLSQVYLPLYLHESLKLSKVYIAIIPLVVYVSSFVTSFSLQCVRGRLLKFVLYFCGICCVLGSCIWYYVIAIKSLTILHVYGASISLGIGCSLLLVKSMCILSDLIGDETSSSAFVYGCMSFVDKLANGVGVAVIQLLHPCPKNTSCCEACEWFYRNVLGYVPAGIIIIAFLILITLFFTFSRPDQNVVVYDADETRPLLNSNNERT